jgi:hypothetical protein
MSTGDKQQDRRGRGASVKSLAVAVDVAGMQGSRLFGLAWRTNKLSLAAHCQCRIKQHAAMQQAQRAWAVRHAADSRHIWQTVSRLPEYMAGKQRDVGSFP